MQAELWTKAATLRKESAELLRKAQWQAQSMAVEGHSSEAIDRAISAKLGRMKEIEIAIEATMIELKDAA